MQKGANALGGAQEMHAEEDNECNTAISGLYLLKCERLRYDLE